MAYSDGDLTMMMVSTPTIDVARGAADYCRDIANFLRATPDAWCQGSMALDAQGRSAHTVDSPWARRWCALGLIERFVDDPAMRRQVVMRAMRVISPLNGQAIDVHQYNDQDGTRVEDIIAMFECAALMPRDFAEVQGPAAMVAMSQYVEMLKTAQATMDAAEQPVECEAATVNFSNSVPAWEKGKSGMKFWKSPPDWEQFMVPALPKSASSSDEPVALAKQLIPWPSIMASIKSIAA